MSTPLDSERIRFLERAFVNCQELSRLMDQKAGFLLATIGILTAALGAVCREALTTQISSWLQALAVVCALFYVGSAFINTLLAVQVFVARSHETSVTHAPGLLFPLILLKRHDRSEDIYKAAADSLTMELIVQEYSNQILEISRIYEVKQKRVNLCVRGFTLMAIAWLSSLLLSVLSSAIHG